jgi:group I intron endonuclease
MWIYLIVNRANGKRYVGKFAFKSKTLQQYFEWNLTRAISGSKAKPYLYNAIRKYGKKAFCIAIIDGALNNMELLAKEREWIRFYHSNDPNVGYNCTGGGEGIIGFHHSDETKRKIGNANRGNKYWLGKHHTAKTRKKMSDVQKGHKPTRLGAHNSEEHNRKISESNEGRHPSDETRALWSKQRKGRPGYWKGKHREMSESHRRNIGIATKGLWKNPEYRKKVLDNRPKHYRIGGIDVGLS